MKKYLPSLLIALFVGAVIVINVLHSARYWFGFSDNLTIISEKIRRCQRVTPNMSGNKVILRVDDIQAFAFTDVTEKFIEDARSRNMLLVFGLIPKDVEKDHTLVKLIRKNLCNIELAIHGWDHDIQNPNFETGEFEKLDFSHAYERINKGLTLIKTTFNVRPVTFIPPYNSFSEGTVEAVKKLGLPYFSAGLEGELDVNTSTYDFDNKLLIDVSSIVDTCKKLFEQKKMCVVMLHPQDYYTNKKFDQQKYNSYLLLLDKLNEIHAQTVLFKEL